MRLSHIEVAATSGMKKGLQQYVESLSKSGLDQAHARLGEVLAIPAKKRLGWYCENFGAKVDKAKNVDVKAQPRSRAQRVEVVQTALELEIAQAREVLENLLSQASRGSTVTKPVSKPKQARSTAKSAPKAQNASRGSTDDGTRTFSPVMAAKKGIPSKAGASFTYKGKRRSTKMVVQNVKRDGTVVCKVAA